MNVAMLGPEWEPEGIAAYCADLAAHIGRRVHLDYVPIPPGHVDDEECRRVATRLNDGDIVHIQHHPEFFGGVLPEALWFDRLRNAIERPVVVTAHTAAPADEVARELPVPAAIRLQSIQALLDARFRRTVDTEPFIQNACVVLSSGDRDLLVGRGVPEGILHVIPAGAPSPAPRPDGAELRRSLHLEGKRVLFQEIHSNEYRVTLRILQELEPDICLLLSGWPPHRVRQAKTVSGTAGGRAVYYVPEVPGSFTAMALADVLVASGETAGGPRDVLKALSMGIPVAAPDTDRYREIQRHEACLRLVRPGDADHLAACVKALFHNAIGRAEMAERGQRYAAQHGWDWVADQTIALYRNVLADRDPSSTAKVP
ncbi:MAG: glycosyltransferase family 4 protein [Chthonomonadales bacterium]